MTAQPIRRHNAHAKPVPKLLFTIGTKAKAKRSRLDLRTGLALRIHRAVDEIDKSSGWSSWILTVNIFPKKSIAFCWRQPRLHDPCFSLATAWRTLPGCPWRGASLTDT